MEDDTIEPKRSKGENRRYKNEKMIPMPACLKGAISKSEWDSWSNIRRKSYYNIETNPNTFYYRNRPPGEKQKIGGFDSNEKKQFLERLKYFQEELGITDGKWGNFAVPLVGRVGYQCSNFYRKLVEENQIQDPNYTIVEGKLKFTPVGERSRRTISKKVIAMLDKEANDYTTKCVKKIAKTKELNISPDDLPDFAHVKQKPGLVKLSDVPKPQPRIRKPKPKPENPKPIPPIKSLPSTPKKKPIKKLNPNSLNVRRNPARAVSSNILKLEEENEDELESFSSLSNSSEDNPENEGEHTLMKTRRKGKKVEIKSKHEDEFVSDEEDIDIDYSKDIMRRFLFRELPNPILYAPDPLTLEPMTCPMFDIISGNVFDHNTWVKIFEGEFLFPDLMFTQRMEDLIEINGRTFKNYWLQIKNVSF